jgi:hypothetical protein
MSQGSTLSILRGDAFGDATINARERIAVGVAKRDRKQFGLALALRDKLISRVTP